MYICEDIDKICMYNCYSSLDNLFSKLGKSKQSKSMQQGDKEYFRKLSLDYVENFCIIERCALYICM